MRWTVKIGDIVDEAVDGIVNAANPSLLGGGGVDGAIHRAAGSRLLEACRRIGGCPVGGACITPGFNLPARFVIHAVGPVWQGGDRGEAAVLAGTYRSIWALAEQENLHTLAIPAISTGVYGYPLREALTVATSSIVAASRTAEWEEIRCVAYRREIWEIWCSLWGGANGTF